ncbi:unnamed protein product [Spirodela intermedia]|uniref:X8 domain-containing protein n=1 Tax=Spirodela intermedia TaxID=51605 RepID=A0A7I8IXY7_SPIIN|nr:unnamed protein product [Spirodela intermedia]CAA6662669.1 unnamed protein product [Spirodela intermedia]
MAVAAALSLLLLLVLTGGAAAGLGVNYGRLGSKLPPPAAVARFLAESTVFDHVKLFDCDATTVAAFAGTGIAVDVAIANELIPNLTDLAFAQRWVADNVLPPRRHHPHRPRPRRQRGRLRRRPVPRRRPRDGHAEPPHGARRRRLQDRVKVSSPHSMAVLTSSSPPSTGRFRQGYNGAEVVGPLLSFLRSTGSPFMVNAYPFFGPGVVDPATGLTYTNMLDAQLDAVFSAMAALGFADVEIAVAESGWPSAGEPWEYNGNFLRRVSSGAGTPLMPNRTFEAFVFSLFNEDLKPGPASERNYGLFLPDFSPVYDVGPNTDEKSLQENIDFVCGRGGMECMAIRPGGACFLPDTLQAHAAFAMNAFYQAVARSPSACDFGQTGLVTLEDPSYGSCKYGA